MLAEIERNRGSFDATGSSGEFDLALDLWDQKGALSDPQKLTAELSELLAEMAESLSGWDQDRRDAAQSLVSVLARAKEGLPYLNADQQATIGKNYIDVVSRLKSNEDWLGAPWAALETGHEIAAILGKEIDFVNGMRLRGQLAEAWSNYAAHVSFANQQRPGLERSLFENSFKKSLDTLQKSFLSRDAEAVVGEIERNGPEEIMNPSQKELTLWYGQATSQAKSAKLEVLRATPTYVESIKDKGVDIANFWNLHDPEVAQKAVEAALAHPLSAQLFRTSFKHKTGVDYEEVTLDEARALGDLNLDLVRRGYADLFVRATSYEQTETRILSQVAQASKLEDPRKKLKPILKWIQQLDPGFNSIEPAEIEEFINHHRLELQNFHEQKNVGLNETLRDLEATLPPQSRFVRFMQRDLFDLKSANLTGDCTAWNLKVGFNAWTVPVWVTNPSFNFAYIYSGNWLAAKFGMILAFDKDQKPQVIIDSIETNKNLPSSADATALEAINEGFRELQAWADRNGFGTLQVCTFSNSEELTAELPIVQDQEDIDTTHLTFDGLAATEELLKTIGGDLQTPPIYLQAANVEYDEWGDVINHGEHVENAELFETLAQKALSKAFGMNSRISEPALLEALRSGDKDVISISLIAALVPDFDEAFSHYEYDSLRQLYNNCQAEAQRLGLSFETVFGSAIGQAYEAYEKNVHQEAEDYHEGRFPSIFDDHGGFRYEETEDELEYELEREEERREAASWRERQAEEQLNKLAGHQVDQQIGELMPGGMIIGDEGALLKLREELGTHKPKYEHILDILELFFGPLDMEYESPPLDIVGAARFVFGTPEQYIQEESQIIALRDMPRYDRRRLEG